MSFYTNYFGSYKAYKDWNGDGHRDYVIILINNDLGTQEIVKNSPNGIDDFGLTLDRHDIYHGIFENTSLDLSFSMKHDCGGQYLKAAYDNKGIKADVSAKIYRLNPATKDFILFYDYEINFKADSYNYESGENGDIITVKLNQKGSVAKFGSRDDLELDVTKNLSVGGEIISDVSTENIKYTGIDIYLNSQANGNNFSFITYIPTNTIGESIFEISSGSIITNQIGDDAKLDDVIDSIIYENGRDDTVYLKLEYDDSYTYEVFTGSIGVGFNITIQRRYSIINTNDTVTEDGLISTFSIVNGNQTTGTGTTSYTGIYKTLPSGYKFKVYLKLLYNIPISYGSSVGFQFFSYPTLFKITQKTLSIGDTRNISYRSYNLGLKLMRLITDKDNCFVTSYMNAMNLKNTFFTNGWNLRNFPAKSFIVRFSDYFKSLSYSEGVGLYYYAQEDSFVIRELESLYRDEEIIDFGVVKNFNSYPSEDYYNSLKVGCENDGKYEDDQGVLEYNLQHNYTTDFEVNNPKSMLIPHHIDSLAFELTRRKKYLRTASEDTQYDSDIFIAYTDGDKVITSNLSGFEGIDQYYNDRFLPFDIITRNKGLIGGIFWKDSNNKLTYVSNTKDVEVSKTVVVTTTKNTDNISQADMDPCFFFPENQEFEQVITLDEIQSIRKMPYGYYKCEDEYGVIHYGYFKKIEIQNKEKTIKVVGLTANINRKDE